MGARWTTPDTATPTYRAMKLYRNYDGNRSGFGDVSVRATASSNPDTLSVFAAQRSSTQAVTVMIVNKVGTSAPVALSLAGFSPGASAEVWQLSGTSAIAHLANVAVAANALSLTVPAQSVTLLVVPPASTGTNLPPRAAFTEWAARNSPPLLASFNAAASFDPDGSIASYAWTFGDGGTASGVLVTHTFAAVGSYTTTLTVTDNRGATATASRTIVVASGAGPGSPTGLHVVTGP